MIITSKHQNIIITILVLLGSFCYLSLIFNNNLWMDEAFSAVLVRNSFFDVLKESAADTLPPLYNIINKILTSMFGYHSYILKLSSVLPMIGCLILGATLVKKHFGFETSLLYIICMTGMPYLFYYGVEIRMYSLSLFFTTACGIFAFDYFKTNTGSSFLMYILFGLLAGYTHHFAFVSVGFIYLFLLISFILTNRKRIVDWILSLFMIGILYLPCLFITIAQMKRVNGYFEMPEITPSFVFKCLRYPFVTTYTPLSLLLLLLFLSAPLYCAFHTKKVKSLLPGILGPSIYIGVLIFGSLASLVFSGNIFSERYLVPSLGLFWLGFSVLFKDCKKRILIPLFLFLFLITSRNYILQFQAEYQPGVTEMTNYFNEHISDDDGYLIYEDNYQIEICFRYYFPWFKKYDIQNMNDIKGTIWYLAVPGFESQLSGSQFDHYEKDFIDDFHFDRYSFKLYRLTPNSISHK
ncbi:MAG: hypothetical protein PHY47_15135 [Lachnospiraceae bacterium]|nr:hypothetical protein [Lachnospiraceae bacterium]